MSIVRGAWVAVLAGAAFIATPASAQFYMKSRDLSGAPVVGDEPGVVQPLPGATGTERRAGLVWTMRAALNVAALQCDFAPTLMTVRNYNALLTDHKDELASSWDVLGKYFVRVNGNNKAKGQAALDHFQTMTYTGFATVSAQFNFCQTAGEIGLDAVFERRGKFGTLAENRMRELRNSLTPWGDQTFHGYLGYAAAPPVPRLDAICWSKKGEWQVKKCGSQNWPPAGAGYAAR